MIKAALDNLWLVLQPVLEDVLYGTASPAYTAFFKDSIYDVFVHEMLSNITNGVPTLEYTAENSPQVRQLRSPLIACAFEPGQVVIPYEEPEDLYQTCRESYGACGYYVPSTNLIALCPAFLTAAPEIRRPGARCPPVLGNMFRGAGSSLC